MQDRTNLFVYADLLDDLENVRIANENRLRSLQQVKGIEGAAELEALVEDLSTFEKEMTKLLKKEMRQDPLGPWVKDTLGLGEKQIARLLAATGDPVYATDSETGEVWERTVSQLWAYCGYRPGQQRKKGVKSNWSSEAKMRAFLCAESCMKVMSSPYRKVYDDAREHYRDAKHEHECPRCGPAGNPAKPGSDLSDGHKHARALRKVAKEILKDLWKESRKIEGLPVNKNWKPGGSIVSPQPSSAAPRLAA